MKNNILKFGPLLVAAILIAAFQNCSFTVDPLSSLGVAKANGNGTGYDGKAYASYGSCGVGSPVTLKSLILQNTDGTLVQTVEDCATLPAPTTVDVPSMKLSEFDTSAFVYKARVFDEVRPTLADAKLTRVLCWSDAAKLQTESALFYAPDSLADDTNRVLTGYVVQSDGISSGLMSPILETATKQGNAVFEGHDDILGCSLRIDYRNSGSSKLQYSYDRNTTSGKYSSTRPSVMGCFEQRRPEKILTLDDL